MYLAMVYVNFRIQLYLSDEQAQFILYFLKDLLLEGYGQTFPYRHGYSKRQGPCPLSIILAWTKKAVLSLCKPHPQSHVHQNEAVALPVPKVQKV